MDEHLEDSRREFEDRLADLRDAFTSEFAWAPRTATWLLPLLAGTAGFAAALWLRRSRRRLRGRAARRRVTPAAGA